MLTLFEYVLPKQRKTLRLFYGEYLAVIMIMSAGSLLSFMTGFIGTLIGNFAIVLMFWGMSAMAFMMDIQLRIHYKTYRILEKVGVA